MEDVLKKIGLSETTWEDVKEKYLKLAMRGIQKLRISYFLMSTLRTNLVGTLIVFDNERGAHPHIKCVCLLSQFHLSLFTDPTQRAMLGWCVGSQNRGFGQRFLKEDGLCLHLP